MKREPISDEQMRHERTPKAGGRHLDAKRSMRGQYRVIIQNSKKIREVGVNDAGDAIFG